MLAFQPARWVRLLAATALTALALIAPSAVTASCVQPVPGQAPWALADAVFVGTVTAVANNDRWATVRVEEVWVGPDQPLDVVVRGGPEGDTATSVDRTYAVGSRYVFGVTIVEGHLEDNACSGTTPIDEIDLDAMRPADVRAPTGGEASTGATDGLDLGTLGGAMFVVAVVGGLLVVTVLVARRREA